MIDSSSLRKAIVPLMLAGLAAAAFGELLYATKRGAGISPDSVNYIQAARELIAGHGLVTLNQAGQHTPLTWFPPMYPLILSLANLVGQDPLVAARYISAAFFALAVILSATLALHTTRSIVAGLVAGLLALLSPALVFTCCRAWSEPPFIVFMLAGFALIDLALRRESRSLLATSALLIGLAVITRYVGAMLVPLCLLVIALLSDRRWWQRAIDLLIFTAVSCLPMAIWVVRNRLLGVRTSAREVDFHPPPMRRLESMIQTLTSWAFPARQQYVVITCLLIAMGIGYLLYRLIRDRETLLRQIRQASGGYLLALLVIFSIVYIPAVVFSITFIDPGTTLGDRILSPLFIPLAVILVTAGYSTLRRGFWGHPAIDIGAGIALATITALVLYHSGYRSGSIMRKARRDGIGYAATDWQKSKTVAWIRTLPPGTPLYTNAPDAVYILANWPARSLPTLQQMEGDRAAAWIDIMEGRSRRPPACIVYFNSSMIQRKRFPSVDELKTRLHLRPVQPAEEDAVILVSPRSAPPATQP